MKKLLLILAIAIFAVNANAQITPIRINNLTGHVVKIQLTGTSTATTCSSTTTNIYSYTINVPTGVHSYFGGCSGLPGFNGCAPTAASHVTWTQMSVRYWPSYSCWGIVLPTYSVMTATGCAGHMGRWTSMTSPFCGVLSGWDRIRLN